MCQSRWAWSGRLANSQISFAVRSCAHAGAREWAKMLEDSSRAVQISPDLAVSDLRVYTVQVDYQTPVRLR